jgi:hypothetical protein
VRLSLEQSWNAEDLGIYHVDKCLPVWFHNRLAESNCAPRERRPLAGWGASVDSWPAGRGKKQDMYAKTTDLLLSLEAERCVDVQTFSLPIRPCSLEYSVPPMMSHNYSLVCRRKKKKKKHDVYQLLSMCRHQDNVTSFWRQLTLVVQHIFSAIR